jgi:hypothetical protein
VGHWNLKQNIRFYSYFHLAPISTVPFRDAIAAAISSFLIKVMTFKTASSAKTNAVHTLKQVLTNILCSK